MSSFDDLNRFFEEIERTVLNSKSMLRLGRITKNIIKDRTKSGLNSHGVKLKKLSDPYVDRRKFTGVPGQFGAPERSNLTYTGQLLESFDITGSLGTFSVIIPNTERRRPPDEKGKRFGIGKDKLSNSQVAEQVAKNGRPFFSISKDEGQILAKDVEDNVRRVLNRFL